MVNDMTLRPTDLHRVFIQSLLSRRALREEVALELYRRAVSAVTKVDGEFRPTHATTEEGLRNFVRDVSTVLGDVGMEVRFIREETSRGRSWVVLVNTDAAGAAQSASDLSSVELAYYREIVSGIVTSYPANSLGSNHALRLSRALPDGLNMTQSQAQSLLGPLVSRGWLAKSKRGRYTLAPRAMAELEVYLEKEFEDWVHKCQRCKAIMLTGYVCSNDNCGAHFHGYCYEILARAQLPRCPECRSSFVDHPPSPIGEKAVPKDQDNWARDSLGKKRKRASRPGEVETDGEAELEEEELEGSGEVEQVGAGPSTWVVSGRRSSGRARASVVPETQFDEVGDEAEEQNDDVSPQKRRRG
ncbi:hypothetical protein BCR39DRAFT_530972 [Naematelia encephala]|uniref:Non-structural maintenance of chromosomes element 1 homolog n=1 Tax=Naematelia encephala TaxID=71784 RepID=A0A1Y2B4V7_9TREE|nr:hypothetical protein BCR39DRAFT_530972 [Naematelia encephala]